MVIIVNNTRLTSAHIHTDDLPDLLLMLQKARDTQTLVKVSGIFLESEEMIVLSFDEKMAQVCLPQNSGIDGRQSDQYFQVFHRNISFKLDKSEVISK